MGDVIDVYPYEGKVCNNATGETFAEFGLKTDVLSMKFALVANSADYWTRFNR